MHLDPMQLLALAALVEASHEAHWSFCRVSEVAQTCPQKGFSLPFSEAINGFDELV
jgi:hypothetical protein